MKKYIFLLTLLILLIICACTHTNKFKGNWGFCQYNPEKELSYNEVYIHDSIFTFYIDWFGFLPPLIYRTDMDSLYLSNLNNELLYRGIFKTIDFNSINFILFSIETKDTVNYKLKRLRENIIYQSDTKNVDEFYSWMNNTFVPNFNKRKQQFECD